MTECKYLYQFDYACGHHTWEQLDRRLSPAEYYKREAGKCQACQKAQEKDTTDKRVVLLTTKAKGAHWDERKRTCPVCGEAKALIDTAKGVMCRVCRKAAGLMDGKQGVCDACGRKLILHFTGASMVCRHCWEKATGKAAPADWAQPGPKGGAGSNTGRCITKGEE